MKRTVNHNILVVDDDADLLVSFKDLLETRGYKVDTADTGKGALKMSAKGTYDVVIVDIKLPDIEGTEVLRRIKANSRNMKKIVITGFPNLENAIESITHGVDAYLLKPVEPVEFLKIVEGKLKDKEKEDAYIDNTVRQRMKVPAARSSKTVPAGRGSRGPKNDQS